MSVLSSPHGPLPPCPASPYALQVLTATVGNLCKRWQKLPNGQVHGTPYGQAYFHKASTLQLDPANPLRSLSSALVTLAGNRASCVIRGTPRAPLAEALGRNPALPVRRTLDNFEDIPRAWALIDIDTPPPPGAPPPDLDPYGYAAAVRAALPSGVLQATACAFVLSSSCLLKRAKAGVHFWYLLDAPLPSDILRAWAPNVGADPSLFHPIQVHYTAPPLFAGMADPLACRHGLLPGVIPALPAAPIRAVGARVLAIEKAKEAQHARLVADAQSLRMLDSGHDGDREHTTALQVAQAFGIVTDAEGRSGTTWCDCPRHASESRRSLHIDPDGERWYCFGCQKGGGAWALAAWCLGDDKATPEAIISALRSARLGEEASPT